MQVLNYHRANVQPVSAAYTLDSDVEIKTVRDFIVDGYELNFTNALSSLQDTSSNNYNNLYLTEPKRVDDILQVKAPSPVYPINRATYLKVDDTAGGWLRRP